MLMIYVLWCWSVRVLMDSVLLSKDKGREVDIENMTLLFKACWTVPYVTMLNTLCTMALYNGARPIVYSGQSYALILCCTESP